MGRPYQDADASSYPLVAVCIDKQDKNSQNALKWAMDSLVQKGQTVVLVHVNTKGTSGGVDDGAGFKQPTDPQMKDLFRPFRCFCTRKDIQCKDVVLDESDVAKAIIEFAANGAIEKLVIGATARGGSGSRRTSLSKWFYDIFTGAATGAVPLWFFYWRGSDHTRCWLSGNTVDTKIYVVQPAGA
jgi:nucleotide-binding universal stress UspA family protein